VLGAAAALEAEGRPVAMLGVDRNGRVDLDELARAASDPAVGLVSLHAANNEVGTLVPPARVAAALGVLGRARPRLHTDAVQALGRVPLDLAGVDLASFSAHKVGGPLGAGVLVRRRGVALAPLVHGGGQEAGLRPGTENVPAIAAGALAIELAVREREAYHARTLGLARLLWSRLSAAIPSARLAGPPLEAEDRLPNTLAVLLEWIDGRVLVARLDLEGLEASAGSACASGSIEPSHVLLAMGYPAERARAGLRLSLGRTTGSPDIHRAVEILSRTFAAAR
jgi:cysteine desulfurase